MSKLTHSIVAFNLLAVLVILVTTTAADGVSQATVNCSIDVGVVEGGASNPAGATITCRGVANNDDYALLMLMGFDLTGIPIASVQTARLRIYCVNDHNDLRGGQVRVFGLNETWDSNATFATRDGTTPWSGGEVVTSMDATRTVELVNEGTLIGATLLPTNPSYVPGSYPTGHDWRNCWIEFNVTTLITDWVTGTRTNYGLALTNTNKTPGNPYGWVEMQWNSADSGNKPQLIIDYTPLSANPTVNSGGGADFFTIQAAYNVVADGGTIIVQSNPHYEQGINFNRPGIDVSVSGLGALNTTIVSNGTDRIFNITTGNVRFVDLSLSGGSTSDSGGGIYYTVSGGTLTIEDCVIRNCAKTGITGGRRRRRLYRRRFVINDRNDDP